MLQVCSLSSIYISITHSQELEAYLFVIPVIGFIYYMDEKINHISLLTEPSFPNKCDQKPCLRIFHREYCTEKKTFKQGAQKYSRPVCKPKIKMKTGDWKKLDLFLQYTAFLGKHAVILSACIR